jgi:hypothetical protein
MPKGPEGPFVYLERVKGIEPSYEAWEAAVLPLNYTRKIGSNDNARAWRHALRLFRTPETPQQTTAMTDPVSF